ncbi:DUF2264 domain-containing protein [Pedobacter nyackensis]|uniref:DUF2264 domain-containing protein n=1 Tax=Pedobacter nyackensis TaxID=475255 RepID=A0A1W2EYB3_9SPHI|nr:DUF2264 domain-containing protein [Pedobacter nyackensis]SMD14640.1 hypothetical protein SAMN04488101_117116 [Pedobacter nyackensis]
MKYKMLFALLMFFQFTSAQNKNRITTGLEDREFWVKSLYKISYPVIHNLANETLKKNMPLAHNPDYGLNLTKVTYLEAVGRTMAGVAPWLALPDDETKEGKMRKTMRLELLKGLTNSVNPASPDYISYRSEGQPIVDAAYVAQAFLRAPKALWEPLDELTKKRFIEEFKSLRTRTGAYNNWLLFAGLTEGFLLSIGEQYDPARVQFAVNKMKEWYVGDSWYSDGAKFSMDYYNSYVIHSMLVDLLKVLADKKKAPESDYNLAVKRMVRYSEYLERLISPEGTYSPYGRSITYRTAAFQALAQTALMDKLPEYIKPAQVRCALTKVMRNMYEGNQNFDDKGWLVLGFNGHQPEIADIYTSTGSLYMATLGFLTLGLPADHKFWTDVFAPWTSLKAWKGEPIKKDYKVEY